MKKLTSSDKPTKRCVTARVPHGVKPQLVLTIYPDGILGIRELGRRREYQLDVATLYVTAIRREVAARKGGRR